LASPIYLADLEGAGYACHGLGLAVAIPVTMLAVSDPGIALHDGKLTLPPDSVALLEDRP
jgi:hypothetical protein